MDTNGWASDLSRAGKIAAKEHNIPRIIKKLQSPEKKFSVKYSFMPASEQNEVKEEKEEEEGISIFEQILNMKIKEREVKKQNQNQNVIPPKDFTEPKKINRPKNISYLGGDRLKYHKRHIDRIKGYQKEKEVHDIKYNPNYDYIKSKTASSVEWKKLKVPRKKWIYSDAKFYINFQDPLDSEIGKKGFKEMGKQTMRNGFPAEHDVRIIHEKKFEEECSDSPSKIKTGNNTKVQSMSNSNSFSNYSNKELLKSKSTLYTYNKLKKNKSSGDWSFSKSPSVKDKKVLLIPDFSKTISRQERDKIYKVDKPVGFSIDPNFKAVQERPLMLVTYKPKQSCCRIKKKFKELPDLLDLDKCFYKYNNHTKPISPTSFKMTPRPQNTKLPSFMHGIYTRASSYNMTNKSLLMNNFANGTVQSTYSSFFPKRSFNKNINLALLNSNVIDTKDAKRNPYLRQLSNSIQKSMGFYHKNFDELWKDNDPKKFDCVTMRSLKRDQSMPQISKKDNEKFTINFKKFDENNWSLQA
ncbi:MAG: hypothetical protein MJ252_03375 [archaeon]|nr:hypothetical protein [archaeon]